MVTKPLCAPWNDAGKAVPRALALAAAAGVEPRVLVARGDTATWPDPVRAHALYPDAGGYRTGIGERLSLPLGVWSRRGDADLLHFFFQPHPLAVRAARWLAQACRRPSVHTVLSAPHLRHPAARVRFADRTVTLSHATAMALERPGWRTPEVIPPALLETEPAAPERVLAARASAELEPGFLIYPGDWEFSGGHELLFDAWAKAPDLPPLVLAGRDKTTRAAAARAALERRCQERGIARRVRFLGTASDLPALLASAGAVLFPARSLYAKADLPLVLLEAWRESRPVLVSDLAPLAEAVAGVNHPLPLEADTWIRAVRALAEGGEALGRAGRARLLERHGARRCAERYAEIYRELMAGRTDRAENR